MISSKDRFYLINIVTPIFIGLVFYILFSTTYVANGFRYLFSTDIYELTGGNGIINFIRCYLADILWAYSLTFSVHYIFRSEKNPILIVFLICVGFEIAVEYLQYFGFFKGTFDIFDILIEIAITCLALFLINLFIKEKKDE